jgi:glutaredoxin
LNVQVLGISVDHVPCLKSWAESIDGITFPLLSDFWPHGEVAKKYGVLRDDGKSERAIFIIDTEGIIQYIDIHDIDDQPDNEVLFAELERISPTPKPLPPPEEALPTGGVVLYCNSWCPSCRKARIWLADNNIDYIEVDVNKSRKAAEQVREWTNGNLSTPTIDVNGTIVINWDQKRMEELLL